MKFLIYSFSMLLLLECKSVHREDHAHIKIVLDTEEPLSDTDTIFLMGNHRELANWNPRGLAMMRRADSRWEQTFHIDSSHVEFKFTLGSMDKEAVSNRGVVPSNSIIYATRDTEVYFVIEDWKHLQKVK